MKKRRIPRKIKKRFKELSNFYLFKDQYITKIKGVRKLQIFLNEYPDGIFGANTRLSFIKFYRKDIFDPFDLPFLNGGKW